MKNLPRLSAWLVVLSPVLLGACGLQKHTEPATVLRTEDFIADSTTIPTEAARPAGVGTPQAISAAAASDGLLNVTAVPGAPTATSAPTRAVEPPALIDAKVGELNGRPIRARDLLDQPGGGLGPMLQSVAKERKLTPQLWSLMMDRRNLTPAILNSTLRREDWIAFAQRIFYLKLNSMLEDQLLAEEARFSLKPEQRPGLRYLAQEFAESARREAGGSRVLSQERLREKGMTEREYIRKGETDLLISYELSERLRKRIRTSWKDVRLYYEHNSDEFNPPPVAYFRLIRVPADKPEAVARIQAALDAGTPFAEVAAMPENAYNAKEGGRYDPQTFKGEFEKGSFFPGALNDAAVRLQVGGFTKQPVDAGNAKSWLALDRIERRNRPLSDRDVQLVIANRLNADAFKAEHDAYIERLKRRATFTDLPVMAQQLAEIAAARYWPKE